MNMCLNAFCDVIYETHRKRVRVETFVLKGRSCAAATTLKQNGLVVL